MTTRAPRTLAFLGAVTLIALPAAGCASNTAADAAGEVIAVSSTNDACAVSATSAPAGSITFSVTNDGTDVTEFYVLGEDGQKVVGEVENIGPGLTRDLVVLAEAGEYFTSCKPGMKGDGIRAGFTVTESDADPAPTGAATE